MGDERVRLVSAVDPWEGMEECSEREWLQRFCSSGKGIKSKSSVDIWDELGEMLLWERENDRICPTIVLNDQVISVEIADADEDTACEQSAR